MYMHSKCTIEQWRAFQAVADQGGYQEAAEYLNKSQSTVSHAVAQLQLRLGKQLFKIVGRKAVLTPIGEIMLHRSRILLEDAFRLENIAQRTHEDWPAEITVVIDDPFDRGMIARALSAFQTYSDTRVQLFEESLSGCLEYLERNEADIVIAHNVPKGYIEFAQVQITQTAVAHYQSNLHQLPKPLSIDDLKREIQLIVADSGTTSSVNKGWRDAPNRWRVGSSQLSVALLLQNIGFAWLPTHYIAPYQDSLIPLALENGQQRSFFLNCLFGKKTQPNQAALAFSECLKQAIAG